MNKNPVTEQASDTLTPGGSALAQETEGLLLSALVEGVAMRLIGGVRRK